MKVDQSGFSPLQFQETGNIQRTQPPAPQPFPDITQSKPAEVSAPEKTESGLTSHAPVQGSSLSQYLNQEEKEMLNRLFPTSGRRACIQAYQQTQAPVEPQENILGQRIDIRT